ncbi:methylthioribose kinase [Paenisporosarcina macmurdoensis]|jgi:hypothetical protein|uniref:Methylthioribose kinase n=1 Tax=Paenisporosarcina macmurdoensis TaxID=212659 RepID=A0ABW1L265_9BACL|nr:methylthioribose kinase [Paenisporosarcina sp.]
MIQRFIELGEGYSDIFEWLELLKTNENRFHHVCIFTSVLNDVKKLSVALVLKPASEGNFTPIYYCREGIEYSAEKTSKRILLVEKTLQERNYSPHRLEVKHSSYFAEPALYHQYLTGLLRLHHILPPLS